MQVYLEVGSKKTFAGALEWPGWCRSGRDEAGALEALLGHAARYRRVVQRTGLGFTAPTTIASLRVVERLTGDATTDFGAPGAAPSADSAPMDPAELQRALGILEACWRAFDAAVESAGGRELRRGPRGGGRQLEAIVRHVLEAEGAYLNQLGYKYRREATGELREERERLRQAAREGLGAAARGELPRRGPRGGLRWTPRYFVRRSAWHVLDHAWEIEDRM
jgi:hypothetical protein